MRVICNADLDPQDINAAKQAREQLLKERWNEVDDSVESFLRRPRYKRLYEILKKGNVEIRVVSRADAPFLHGKAGVIRRPDGSATSFMGSLNETREGWSENYELVWEDSSADGVAWVEDEFEHLWALGKPLPDAIIDEIGRSARRVEVQLEELEAQDVAPAALVESNLYRGGEQLMPWQRAFVGLFLHHRAVYGKVRLLLADEVGVGKTLSLAGSALVSALMGDGPVLILCPATLTTQWQMELKDKLNIPSAVWLSSEKAWQLDPDELPLPSVGAEGIVEVSSPDRDRLHGPDLPHDGRATPAPNEEVRPADPRRGPSRPRRQSRSARTSGRRTTYWNSCWTARGAPEHVLLGTATPIQTDVADLWDLMKHPEPGRRLRPRQLHEPLARSREGGAHDHRRGERHQRARGVGVVPQPDAAGEGGRRHLRPCAERHRICQTTNSSPTSPTAKFPTRTISFGPSSRTMSCRPRTA